MRKARNIAGLGALVDPENRWDLSYSSIRVGFNLVSGIPYDTHYTLHSRGGNGNAKPCAKRETRAQKEPHTTEPWWGWGAAEKAKEERGGSIGRQRRETARMFFHEAALSQSSLV